MEKLEVVVRIFSGLIVAVILVVRLIREFAIPFDRYSFTKRILSDNIKRS